MTMMRGNMSSFEDAQTSAHVMRTASLTQVTEAAAVVVMITYVTEGG